MTLPLTIGTLRARALQASLFKPTTLADAVARLGFVQADPIRAPARAQDLILRQRVSGYRAGDLEQRFGKLGLEEDFLYAYGFMPPETMRLLHPRPDRTDPDKAYAPTGLAAEVLTLVRARATTHPKDLEAVFGRDRATNAWGGFSKATTQVLHELHYHGLLRVIRRQEGIRTYAAAPEPPEPLSADERIRRLILLVAGILAPISEVSLRGTLSLMRRGAPGLGPMGSAIHTLLASGALESGEIDRERYLWPAVTDVVATDDQPARVRFLAPFDPTVWDRRRFEHLWGWAYRFEAYTPAPLRQFGYYAMPMLWRDRVIGWANVSIADGTVKVEHGFVGPAPKGENFRRAFESEVARMERFLT
ncbi:DNA glycosylase AlkZ-like family protein [Acidisoma cladoniae]|uniref:DNA glycosylase AlkZ-like family protein n=1 Tax=Acidisoma cladoniae TaxID=3040935 RepID=UPI00254D56DE|nr:crosslink repair DNA glycosylase YcaQ family protein [Acidisoma sp. PAMC 29798]